MLKFEWNIAKSESNKLKHGVTFEEAATIFGDPLAYTFEDPDHSVGEERMPDFRGLTQGAASGGGSYKT